MLNWLQCNYTRSSVCRQGLTKCSHRSPTAGGQYHWVSELTPPKWQKPLSYVVGKWLFLTRTSNESLTLRYRLAYNYRMADIALWISFCLRTHHSGRDSFERGRLRLAQLARYTSDYRAPLHCRLVEYCSWQAFTTDQRVHPHPPLFRFRCRVHDTMGCWRTCSGQSLV